MVPKRYEFHPEGDILLRFSCPKEKDEAERQQDDQNDREVDDKRICEISVTPDLVGSDISVDNDDSTKDVLTEDVVMIVSSAHLTLASPAFKKMLQTDGFKEGKELQTTGKVEIPLPEDDVDAFELLMNVVHNRTRFIPRNVDLDRLTSLSILADKYQVTECLELVLEMWMPSLQPSKPTKFTLDLPRWLSLAWIFNFAKDFKEFTRIAILESDGQLKSPFEDFLPFPDRIIAEIETQRQHCIANALAAIQHQMNLYTGPQGVCSFRAPGSPVPILEEMSKRERRLYPSIKASQIEANREAREKTKIRRRDCDGMMLGTFIKSALSASLWPLPLRPYESLTPTEIINIVCKLRIVSLCHSLYPNDGVSAGELPFPIAHESDVTLVNRLIEIKSSVVGLNIEDFQNPSDMKSPMFGTSP